MAKSKHDFQTTLPNRRSYVRDGNLIVVRDNNVDQALRALKKKTMTSGVMRKVKAQKAFQSSGEKRREAEKQSQKRHQKRAIAELAKDMNVPKSEAKAIYFGRNPKFK